MIFAESYRNVSHKREPRVIDTFEGHVTDVLGSKALGGGVPGPQAFLVDQNPSWVTPAHFHVEDQFQVVTAGDGAIGKHAVAPLAVHYASADNGYGPITAGPEGISYLTMRAVHDTGAWYLHKPGSREKLRKDLPKLQAYGSPAAPVEADALAGLSAPVVDTLIAPRDNGLAAHLVRLPPGAAHSLAAEHAHGGRYYVVTHGSARLGEKEMAALGVGFATPEETPAVTAGAGGAAVLVLQFARSAIGR